jgi:hypothetical protein
MLYFRDKVVGENLDKTYVNGPMRGANNTRCLR